MENGSLEGPWSRHLLRSDVPTIRSATLSTAPAPPVMIFLRCEGDPEDKPYFKIISALSVIALSLYQLSLHYQVLHRREMWQLLFLAPPAAFVSVASSMYYPESKTRHVLFANIMLIFRQHNRFLLPIRIQTLCVWRYILKVTISCLFQLGTRYHVERLKLCEREVFYTSGWFLSIHWFQNKHHGACWSWHRRSSC